MKISHVHSKEYSELLAVWEDSVRATHDFISDEDIEYFKPLIMEHGFPAVTLRCIKNNEKIVGFIGVASNKIEMLFVLNNTRGKGIGSALLNYAIEHFDVNKVDVNEQNPKAVGFYQHMGFEVYMRSPIDDMGKPFPILHLKRQSSE